MQNTYRVQLRWLCTGACYLFLLLILASCSATRKLPEGQYLLRKNKVIGNTSIVTDQQLLNYARQKPNKKTFGFWRYHLQVYNLVNQEKHLPRYEKRIQERRKLNEERRAAGLKLKNDRPLSFNNWLLTIGEAPVIFDSSLLYRSTKQLELLLKNNGYFDAVVKDSAFFRPAKKTADVFFTVNPGKPYLINSITYAIPDPTINSLVNSTNNRSLIKTGNNYNVDVLDQERDRITEMLKDRGYYAFIKNFITYSADSTIGEHKIDLTLIISNPLMRVPGFVDSTVERSHIRYKINNIYVNGNYSLRPDTTVVQDTLYFDNIHYISRGLLSFKPKSIKPAIYINRGDLYSKRLAERTYSRLSDYRAFKFINVEFRPVDSDSTGKLNCEIQVSPMARNAFTMQAQGTNTGGNFGIAADLIYQNKNLLKGLELFEFRINGTVEAQRLSVASETENGTFENLIPFNTYLFGPEASIQFPKFLLPFKYNGRANQKTRISSSYNYQQRRDYQRAIFNLSYGYTSRPRASRTHIFNPVEINYVDVTLTPDFENLLNLSKNLFLKNSFTSQFITSMRYTHIRSNQQVGGLQDFYYFQGNVENSGLLLNILNNTPLTEGKHELLGAPYSQFFLIDGDFRKYNVINKSSSIAQRIFMGAGLPYGNSTVMPFVKSYFGGGANGVRAWIARALGPGSYTDTTGQRLDQVGDIRLEYNIEYRAKLYKILEGAVFADAGNIWLRKEDPARPGAEFKINRFYQEIAIGAGLGMRLNFDYFIIRIDAAHPLREPAMPEGDRWAFNRLRLNKINFNFGIGYPF